MKIDSPNLPCKAQPALNTKILTSPGQLTAQPKDVLELTPVAADNSEGGAIRLTVQGTAQEPTLPPDPINDGIAPQLDPLLPYTLYDSTRFLYTNNPPVQTGIDPDTIKPKLASLLVGKTLDRNDQPLSGVTVKVKDHDQYGQTLTREDGQWDGNPPLKTDPLESRIFHALCMKGKFT
jgi:hypothetical protein